MWLNIFTEFVYIYISVMKCTHLTRWRERERERERENEDIQVLSLASAEYRQQLPGDDSRKWDSGEGRWDERYEVSGNILLLKRRATTKPGTIRMVVGNKWNGAGHWEWYSLTTPGTIGTGKLLCAVRIKLYCVACCRMDQWQGMSAR